MRSLSSAMTAAFGGTVQRPGWLVRIAFSPTPACLSSLGDVTYDGETYYAYDLDVSRVAVSDNGAVAGTIRIGNLDDAFSSLVLGQGISDRAVRIIGFDGGAVGTSADFVVLADCVGGRARVGIDKAQIDVRDAAEFVSTPRTFVNAASGFSYLIPNGATFTVNGQTYTLERK